MWLYVFFQIILFIFGCAGSLLPCGLFSRYTNWGLLYSYSVQASHYSGFSACRAWALWCRLQQLQFMGSAVVAPRLQSTGSIAVACALSCSGAQRIYPDQGLNLFPALAGGFFTTESQERSATIFSMNRFLFKVIKKKKLNYFINVMFPIFNATAAI